MWCHRQIRTGVYGTLIGSLLYVPLIFCLLIKNYWLKCSLRKVKLFKIIWEKKFSRTLPSAHHHQISHQEHQAHLSWWNNYKIMLFMTCPIFLPKYLKCFFQGWTRGSWVPTHGSKIPRSPGSTRDEDAYHGSRWGAIQRARWGLLPNARWVHGQGGRFHALIFLNSKH